MLRISRLIFLALLVVALPPIHTTRADTGPKPTMDFQFVFTTDKSNIVSGILFECDQSNCSDATPIADLGAQGLYCEPESCRAIAYGFAPYHILEITFADGVTRRSNVFETMAFDSFYTVTVQEQGLIVEPKIMIGGLPASLVVVGVIATGVLGLVYFRRRKAQT